MADWQPIETAPKDGVDVLLHWPSRERSDIPLPPVVGFWNDIVCGWQADDQLSSDIDENEPSHWMPLPKPPQ